MPDEDGAGVGRRRAPAGLLKRSVVLQGHATSVALEAEFWAALDAWAEDEGCPPAALIAALDADRAGGSLASAIRVALLKRALEQLSLCRSNG